MLLRTVLMSSIILLFKKLSPFYYWFILSFSILSPHHHQHTHLVLSIFILLLESASSISKSIILQVKDISSPNLATEGNTFFVFAHHVLWVKQLIRAALPPPIFLRRNLPWHVYEACLVNSKCGPWASLSKMQSLSTHPKPTKSEF